MVLVCLAACGESRYGAYLVVQGEIEFDEIELYFGAPIDSSGTGSGNQFATPTFGQQSGLVFDRKFDASDRVTMMPTTQTTFYLPSDDKNQQLGMYVVAVALSGGQPVGIAEFFDFKVPSDVVHEYHLDLTAWNPMMMERWGERPGCVAWQKQRDGHDPIVAVVRNDDRDCDAMARDVDCSDLCSAGAAGCNVDQTLCDSTGFCALGCNRSGACTPALCLPDATCIDPNCKALTSIDQRLACGREKTPIHLELLLHRDAAIGKALCTRTLMFRPTLDMPGRPCKDPIIESIDPAFKTMFAPVIAQSQIDPLSCELHLTGNVATIADLDEYHALVSIAPANLGPRITFVFGLSWSGSDQCQFEGYDTNYVGSMMFDCL